VADQPCSFVIGGSVSSCGLDTAPDQGPTSLPYTAEEEHSDVRNRQRQLIQQLQEALDEKKKNTQKQLNGVRRTHRSSGDLMSQRMELSWRSKVGV
jgi:hypothetical protein